MIGTIAASPSSGLKPSARRRSRNSAVWRRSFATSSGSRAQHAHRLEREHATVGGSAFEKSCGRERCASMSQTSSLARDEAAGRAAERLAERRGDHVDLAEQAEVLGHAAPGLAQHARAVRVVDDDASRRARAPARRCRGASRGRPP